MGAFTDLFDRLDTDDRVKGKQFEHICKWFLTNDPVYKHELRRVWLWHEWPGRWGIDAGIDLVAEDRNGHLWAIQAKAYDPAYRVTKRDVNKFLAESGRSVFTYRMLIATTNLIDRIGERTIQDQEKRVTFLRLNDLDVANVDWPLSPDDLRPSRGKPARPNKHQRDAINQVVDGFASADRGQLIMACGTGKTLTGLFIGEKLEASRTLVLVPSLSLLKQTLNAWRANSDIEFASLPVCSDDTVAKGDDDVALAHTSELGVPVTTDPTEIASFLRRRSGIRVVFATYQSSPQIAKAFAAGGVPPFDLVIADEAHRCAGPVSSDFATVLDPAKIKAKRRLFMTATPRYFTGRVLKVGQDEEFEYASMDDEARFGTVFYHLSFSEAIQRGLLTDYQVAIIGVDDVTYREWAQRAALVTLDGTKITDARTLAGQIGLAKAMRKYGLRRTISFHSRVKGARQFANSMSAVIAWMPTRQRPKGRLWAKHASGKMPAGDRYVLLQHLGRMTEDELGLLTNARCLAEGVDVPTLDGVAFIDPRRSEVDIVQAVGRAIRLSADKATGTVVIPVFIDAEADPDVALKDSVFKPVWDVLKALRSHDEQLGEELDQLRRELGRYGGRARLPSKIRVDLPRSVGIDFARAFDIRLVEATTPSWEFWYGLLEKFVQETGHARIPASATFDGYKLGDWVSNQRTLYSRGTLRADRKDRLGQVHGWTWDFLTEQWDEAFDRLVRYTEKFGNASVPRNFKDDDGYQLGWWVRTQCTTFAKGLLAADREERLKELPGWDWDRQDAKWEGGFRHLAAYVKEHGNARVPVSYEQDGYPLGSWVRTQCTALANGTLRRDRAERLKTLPGWVWDRRTGKWEEGFRHLVAYVEEHGDAQVPQAYMHGGFALGAWVGTQRTNFTKGLLEAARQERLLEATGWVWDTKSDKWEQGFNLVLGYVEEHGDANVPRTYVVDGYNLGQWVKEQRRRNSEGRLEADRRQRLGMLPGWIWKGKPGPRRDESTSSSVD